MNEHLQTAAQEHAQFLYNHKKEYYDPNGNQIQDVHWQFLANGKARSILERVLDAGYGSVTVSENICVGAKTIEELIMMTNISHSHKKTMLSTEYQEIGIYVVADIVVLKF
ncbi:MAG: CAP domain-containing protein [bacterium]